MLSHSLIHPIVAVHSTRDSRLKSLPSNNLRRREKSMVMQTYNSALKRKVMGEPNLISEVEKGFLEEAS